MPSKNRKHFAVTEMNTDRVLDSVSSDAKNYLWAIVTPGKKTKWLEEYTDGALAVYQTDERLSVGDYIGSLTEREWMSEEAPPTKEELTAPETPEEYHEAVQAAREELTELKPQPVSRADMQTHHDTRPPAKKPAAQRVYKTGQRWTKPGTGIVAKVFLVKDDGRAYARGNRRNLTRILLDESWELV